MLILCDVDGTAIIGIGMTGRLMVTMIEFAASQRTTELSASALRIEAPVDHAVLRGWFNFYGKYCGSAMRVIAEYFNRTLTRWARFKYRQLHGSKMKSLSWLLMIAKRTPDLFVHWEKGYLPSMG